MKKLLTLVLLVPLLAFGQNQNTDSVKYVNAIKFIAQNKTISKYRNKHFYKKAKKFVVSKHLIYNYYPLRYLAAYYDSIKISQLVVDSLCEVKKDTLGKILYAENLTLNKISNYVLYLGKPFKNWLIAVVAYNQNSQTADAEYSGICCRPFIILLSYDATNNVSKVYCTAPVID